MQELLMTKKYFVG